MICTTHSPVFLDIAERQQSLVRVSKDESRDVKISQVSKNLFSREERSDEKDRLRVLASFHPTVNEVFFAKRVVLFEESSAIAAFETAAELTGLFQRTARVRRDATLIDCDGKASITLFQQVLNHFAIPYTVIYDEDPDNQDSARETQKIRELLTESTFFVLNPDLEGVLGYDRPGRNKPYVAVKKIEELHKAGSIPEQFLRAMNWVYFGRDSEPVAN